MPEAFLQRELNLYLFSLKYIFAECDGGEFGQNCKESCGKCVKEEQCDHVNGTCMNGCDSGYFGTLCDKGILKIKTDFFKSIPLDT